MNIAIIDNNTLYRESLKTALNQIDGFNVSYDTDNINSFFQAGHMCDYQIVLLDFNFYENKNIIKIQQLFPFSKILIVSNYTEKCFSQIGVNNKMDFISKCSNKNMFEQKIKKLLTINTLTNNYYEN